MAVKHRVEKLEKTCKIKQSPDYLDLLLMSEEAREAVRCYMRRNMPEMSYSELYETKEFCELLAAFPEHKVDIGLYVTDILYE